ncbi:hypothetical protein [Pedobacter sp. WC2423]|uniref:hypothetical protein n=1 Tax=Pedobacter sp. WC2423 TaxID=3234142 RepID=UPI003464FD0B
MKTKNKEKEKSDTINADSYRKRGYYFHADEDFREDWDWGKNKSAGSHRQGVPKKNIPDIFIA